MVAKAAETAATAAAEAASGCSAGPGADSRGLGPFWDQVVSHSSASTIPPFLSRKSFIAWRMRKPTSNNRAANGRTSHWSDFDAAFRPWKRAFQGGAEASGWFPKTAEGDYGILRVAVRGGRPRPSLDRSSRWTGPIDRPCHDGTRELPPLLRGGNPFG